MNPMKSVPVEKRKKWEKEFDEKFVDTEGCQAGHETQPDCEYCKRWGGAEGVPKYDKKTLGTARAIKSFISQALQASVEEERKSIAEEVDSIKGYGKHSLGGAAFTNSICKGCDTGFVAPSTLGGLCHHCETFSKKVLAIIHKP